MTLLVTSEPVQFPRPTPASGLRKKLRDATAQAHARLDARLGALDLTRIAGYRRFLEINAAALLPLENALGEAGVATIFPDWQQRYRSRAILEDLAVVGGELHRLPAPLPLDFAGVLGTAYVLEGSRLGGQFLLRTVEKSRDPWVSGATTFLRHGAGERLWPNFIAMLERHAISLDDDTGAIEAALSAFALFDRAASAA